MSEDEMRHVLHRLERKVDEVVELVTATNGRLWSAEEILHGPATRDGRHTGRGLLWRVETMDERVDTLTTQAAAGAGGQSRADITWRTVIAGAGVIVATAALLATVLGVVL